MSRQVGDDITLIEQDIRTYEPEQLYDVDLALVLWSILTTRPIFSSIMQGSAELMDSSLSAFSISEIFNGCIIVC